MNKGNNETIKVVLYLVIFILIITTVFFVSKTVEFMYHNDNALVNKILDQKWYTSANSYAYETIKFRPDKSITYIFYDKESDEVGKYDECNTFMYSSDDKEFKLKCKDEVKKAIIKSYTKDKLTLNIDDINYVFYSSYEVASK